MKKQTRRFLTSLLVVMLVLCATFSGVSAFAGRNDFARATDSDELYVVSGKNSTVTPNATYVAKDHQSATILDALGKPVVGDGSVSGVAVSLAQGDSFRYTKVIDLTGRTKEKPLFEFAITPETIGVKEVDAFEVILTDAYDETNSLTISVYCSKDTHPADYYRGQGLINGVGYLRAGFNGTLAAMDYFNNNTLRKADGEGAIIFLDFCGIGGDSQTYPLINTIQTNVMSVFYEDATKQLFTHEKNEYWDKKKAVVDFDDEEYFAEPWAGFTTGECFLSIRGLKYQKSAFNFVLTQIDGVSVEEVTTDRKPHVINVDTLGYGEENLPIAGVGQNYPVFEATSVSPYYGELEVTAEVYYGGENGEKVTVTDGRFNCAKAGKYTIVYKSNDGHGKTVKKTLSVTAETGVKGITVQTGDFSADGFVAGDTVVLPSATWDGCIGNGTLALSVVYGGNTVALDGNTFFIPAAGTYEFKYTVTDIAGRTGVASLTVVAESGTVAKFTEEIAVPRYFVSGRPYILPTGYAYNYTDGSGDKIKAKIYYTDESGEKLLPTGKVTPSASSAGKNVTVVYDAVLNGKHSQKEYSVPVIDVRDADGSIDCEKLFYAVEGDPELTVGETDVTIKTSKNTVVDWINPLSVNGFTFSFCGNERFISVKTVSLLLSDVEDPTVSVKFNYTVENGKTYFRLNENGKRYELPEKLYSSDVITLAYKQSDNTVTFSSKVKINAAVTETADGKPFNGFPSGQVTARIIMDGVTGGAKISISQISNQMTGNLSFGEFANPIFGCTEDYGGMKKHGETVKLPKPYVVDAIDPGLPFTLTVYDPNGNPVTATDGTVLQSADGNADYEIVVSEYGTYKIYYAAVDLSSNKANLSYNIEVQNDCAPEIKLNGTLPSEVKVGEKVTLAIATATDDLDETVSIRIYVITEQGQIVRIQNGAFVFKNAGEYQVYYRCCDSAGNMTCAVYTVSVHE